MPKTKNLFVNSPIIKEDGCHDWPGAVHKTGYGATYSRGKPIRAHRLSWEIHKGPIPDGLCVLHKCDNRRCINPEHLFLGTYQDNVNDMFAKGRDNKAKGAANWNTKLTDDDVRRIREAKLFGAKEAELSKVYGVSRAAIYRIFAGHSHAGVK